MDVRMPVKNGVEAAREIRALDTPDAKLVPIIGLTADLRDYTREECLEAGMTEFLSKPVEAAVLYETLIRVLQNELDGSDGNEE